MVYIVGKFCFIIVCLFLFFKRLSVWFGFIRNNRECVSSINLLRKFQGESPKTFGDLESCELLSYLCLFFLS